MITLIHIYFLFIETAVSMLDDCINWEDETTKTRIVFDYKYLEDKDEENHHVLKLISDNVCAICCIFVISTCNYSFNELYLKNYLPLFL